MCDAFWRVLFGWPPRCLAVTQVARGCAAELPVAHCPRRRHTRACVCVCARAGELFQHQIATLWDLPSYTMAAHVALLRSVLEKGGIGSKNWLKGEERKREEEEMVRDDDVRSPGWRARERPCVRTCVRVSVSE